MADSTFRGDRERCERSVVRWELGCPFGSRLDQLDEILHSWVEECRAERDGNYSPILRKALKALGVVASWIASTSDELGLDASDYADESWQTCEDMISRWERGPGLKVPGSHAPPAPAGAEIEPGAGCLAPAQVERFAHGGHGRRCCCRGIPTGSRGRWRSSLLRARGDPEEKKEEEEEKERRVYERASVPLLRFGD